ncbi:hypothetical protein RIF29_03554 [Crotalaria pallida]|uniref:Uncharacterized protein n=1 Tax=Crotalaria pallida TaxID=3830 RepID=A0AAN9J0A3_CROPI
MYRIMRNLEHIKNGLKDLNQRKFKSIDVKEIQAREKLDYIQNLLQSDPMNNHLLKMEKEAKEEHSKAIRLLQTELAVKLVNSNWAKANGPTSFLLDRIRTVI